MRLGYAKHRDALHAIIPTLTRVYQNHAKNLVALMEFFIPVVRFSFPLHLPLGSGLWARNQGIWL